MKLSAWLQGETGRSLALAEHTGRSPTAVCLWQTRGVPRRLMTKVRDFTGGAVTLEDMLSSEPGPKRPGNRGGRKPKAKAAVITVASKPKKQRTGAQASNAQANAPQPVERRKGQRRGWTRADSGRRVGERAEG